MPEIMTVNGVEYAVVKLLGKGKGGYSYLAERGGQPFVLKQLHHEPCDYYQFGDKLAAEVNDYRRLKAAGIPVPALIDVDEEGERILKAYVEGPTAFELVRDGRLPPRAIEQARALAARAESAGLNIDWFPTNFIVRGDSLVYIDFECNDFMPEWSFENWGVRYWSRTPEFEAYLREHG